MTSKTSVATNLRVEALRAPEGCVSYLLQDASTGEALVLDPRLDQVEALLALANAKGARIRFVLDTHTHADHFSGARRLAARAKAELLAPAGSKLAAPARRVEPGSTLALGASTASFLAAPGHTSDSVAVLVDGALFTGDALFVDGVGRTDFPGGSADELLETLERFEGLPQDTVVYPGHDYESQGRAALAELRAKHPVLSLKQKALRRERVAGKGAAIPDIGHFLSWNLSQDESGELPPLVAQALVRGGAALVDVRTPEERAQLSVEGSIAAPLQELDAHAARLPKDAELIILCRSGMRARAAKEQLARRGISSTVLAGGIEAWRAAGLPVAGCGSGMLTIDRQTQLGAGALVLSGVLLGALVSPWALILPGFVGAGLMFAGATGTCGLTKVLALMPWNRAKAAAPAPSCSAGKPTSSCRSSP